MRLISFRIPTTVFGFALLTWMSASPVFARSLSSFPESCTDIKVVENVLIASCDIGDFWHTHQSTAVTLKGIYNMYGKLEDDGSNNPASFQNSCQSNELQDTHGNPREFAVEADVLFASCRTGTGNNYVNASIRMDGIRNDHGNLRY